MQVRLKALAKYLLRHVGTHIEYIVSKKYPVVHLVQVVLVFAHCEQLESQMVHVVLTLKYPLAQSISQV